MPKPRTPEPPEPPEPLEPEAQGSNERSIAKQERLKRVIKQHPQREIPRVESIEPRDAPLKEK
jgi:hypothetical protein